MKKLFSSLVLIFVLATSVLGCSAPHQPLKVHATPGQPQKPNGCIMQTGHCKPATM